MSAQLVTGQLSKMHNKLLQHGSDAIEKTIQGGKVKLMKRQCDSANGRKVPIDEYIEAGNQMANGLFAKRELEAMQVTSPSVVKDMKDVMDLLLKGGTYQNPLHNQNYPLGHCHVCFQGFNLLSDSSYEVEPVLPIVFTIVRGAKTITCSTNYKERPNVVVKAADVQSKMDYIEMTLKNQDCMHDEDILTRATMTDAMQEIVEEYCERKAKEYHYQYRQANPVVVTSPLKSDNTRRLPVVTQSTMAKKEPFDEDDDDDRVEIMGASSAVARMPSHDETMEEDNVVQDEDYFSGRKRSAEEMNANASEKSSKVAMEQEFDERYEENWRDLFF